MEQQYGDDFIFISDEDGKEYELEVLATLEENGETYLALIPADSGEAEELEVNILKRVVEDGEEILVTVDDEEKLKSVYEKIMALCFDSEQETTG